MSPKGQDLLDTLPSYYEEDSATRTVIDVMGRELQRVEDAGSAIQKGAFPQYADDTYGLLGVWEQMMGLPVEPTGTSVAVRRTKVLALLQGRRQGYGYSWVARMTRALGTAQWSYTEVPASYTVNILLPFGSGTYSNAQVAAIARQITPANLIITVNDAPHFVVGINHVGDAL
jgi:uncharacterized protein YmfQ (DUF2313 family)